MTQQSPLSPERERHLVRQLQRGDRGALGELLGAYHRRVYHQCLRLLGNADDAAEVAQDALLKAVQHVDSFKGDSRFGTWLFRIAMNVGISHLRRRKVRQTTSLDGAGFTSGGGDGDGDQAAELKSMIAQSREPQPLASVEQAEQVELLMAALDRMEAGLKGVILLRDLQGMDYQQIADVMGVPVGTIKSRLFRARVALRETMMQMSKIEKSEVRDA